MKLVNKSSISRTNTLDNLFSRDHESPSYAWYLQNMICLYILHSLSKTCYFPNNSSVSRSSENVHKSNLRCEMYEFSVTENRH